MTSTPKQRRTQFALSIVLVTANLFLLNWLGMDKYARVDLTRDGVYTLNDATRKLLGGLDDLVTAKVYLSEKQFREAPGWSLLPRTMLDAQLAVLELDGMTLTRALGVVAHAGHTPSNAARALRALLEPGEGDEPGEPEPWRGY